MFERALVEDEGANGQVQLVEVQHSAIALDIPQLFQFLDPVGHGRRGQADAPADLCGREPTIFLQFFEDVPVEIIQHFIIYGFVHDQRLKMRYSLPKSIENKPALPPR